MSDINDQIRWDAQKMAHDLNLEGELKQALDAMARTFTQPVWENTSAWHWAWEYKGEEPPKWVFDEENQRWVRQEAA